MKKENYLTNINSFNFYLILNTRLCNNKESNSYFIVFIDFYMYFDIDKKKQKIQNNNTVYCIIILNNKK